MIDMDNEFERLTGVEWAVRRAEELPPQIFYGWLISLVAQTFRNTNQLLEEIRGMATNDADLTQAVQDLLDAYNANTTALEAELDALKGKGLDGADPAITAAVTNIENIVAKMKQSTSDATAAIAPASGDANPTGSTQPSSTGSASSTDTGSTGSTPGGDLPAGGSSTDAGSAGAAGAAS